MLRKPIRWEVSSLSPITLVERVSDDEVRNIAQFRIAGDGLLRSPEGQEAILYARFAAMAPRLLDACGLLLGEFEKLTRYGSPMAKAANEAVAAARSAIEEALDVVEGVDNLPEPQVAANV